MVSTESADIATGAGDHETDVAGKCPELVGLRRAVDEITRQAPGAVRRERSVLSGNRRIVGAPLDAVNPTKVM